MKKINILLIVLLLFTTVSCDDFLNREPSNQGDSKSSVQSVRDAEVMMNGIMRKMSSSSYYGRNFIMYGDAKGGDLGITSQGKGLDGLYTFNHNPSSGSYSGFWSQIYYCITQVNNLLDNIQRMDDASFNQVKGEALTARACMYFDLVRLYGQPYDMNKSAYGVPQVLTVIDANAQLLRATVEENYTQILKDLTEGADLMAKSKKKGYFNYYANRALAARVNLYMKNYGQALSAAKEIIESKVYTLYKNDKWYESWTKENSSESILEIAMYPDEADLGTASLGFYLMRYGKKKGAMGWFTASDYFLARLGEDPADIRWQVMEYDEIANDRLGSCLKYSLGDKEGSTTAVNIKVIRLSEVYLIAAEAALLGTPGDKTAAVGYLNEIRKRSPSLAPANESTITLDMILDERSKELFAEGHRFFDMMRCNKSITFCDEMITPAVQIQHREKTIDRTFYRTILPIPLDEINSNPKIDEQQNPGYPKAGIN